MAKQQQEVYFVFMNFDPVYERLRAERYVPESTFLALFLDRSIHTDTACLEWFLILVNY